MEVTSVSVPCPWSTEVNTHWNYHLKTDVNVLAKPCPSPPGSCDVAALILEASSALRAGRLHLNSRGPIL